MRKLEDLIVKYGNPVFETEIEQDKTMVDEDLHDITDIPIKVIAFLLPIDTRNTNLVNKYIVFCKFGDDNNWYANVGKSSLIKLLLDAKLKTCDWKRSFDGHFNISCVEESKERANGEFKQDNKIKSTKWNFKYCPYCGLLINVHNG